MAVHKKVFTKKKTKKSVVPKKQLLGHKAVKSLVKLSKTVRTNLIRKHLRKIKTDAATDESLEKKLSARIAELKVRSCDDGVSYS
jgi:hypothetical protein